MGPKMGRPPKENPKNMKINVRLTEETAKDLEECAEALQISRASVIEKGIKLVKASLKKK
jgi:predicted transcriptional regulator